MDSFQHVDNVACLRWFDDRKNQKTAPGDALRARIEALEAAGAGD